MERFPFHREMRLFPYTRRTWSSPRGLLLILSKHVFSLKTPKEMFDSLTKLFEWKNINWKMTLRNQLKNVKIQNAETIQSYFTRVSEIRE